jgi:hypothetical protein
MLFPPLFFKVAAQMVENRLQGETPPQQMQEPADLPDQQAQPSRSVLSLLGKGEGNERRETLGERTPKMLTVTPKQSI